MESRGRIGAGISAPLGRSQTSESERGGENVKILHRGRWWPKKVLCGGDFGLAGLLEGGGYEGNRSYP